MPGASLADDGDDQDEPESSDEDQPLRYTFGILSCLSFVSKNPVEMLK